MEMSIYAEYVEDVRNHVGDRVADTISKELFCSTEEAQQSIHACECFRSKPKPPVPENYVFRCIEYGLLDELVRISSEDPGLLARARQYDNPLFSPLRVAAQYGRLSIVQWLVESHGANPDEIVDGQHTRASAFHFAVHEFWKWTTGFGLVAQGYPRNYPGLVEYLVTRGCSFTNYPHNLTARDWNVYEYALWPECKWIRRALLVGWERIKRGRAETGTRITVLTRGTLPIGLMLQIVNFFWPASLDVHITPRGDEQDIIITRKLI